MAGFGLPLALFSLLASSPLCRAYDDAPLECVGQAAVSEKCLQPLANVTELVPNVSYFAHIPCVDCGVKRGSDRIVHQDNDLLFNITLSHDNRTLLVNGHPIFPAVPTVPHPPNIRVAHIDPDFARTHLDDMRGCVRTKCPDPDPQCPLQHCLNAGPFMSSVTLDYQTWPQWLDTLPADPADPDTRPTERWHVALDPIRGLDAQGTVLWNLTSPSQTLLRIELSGREVAGARYAGEKDIQTGSSLFGSIARSQLVYEYAIRRVDVSSPHVYAMHPDRRVGFFGAIRRFFGAERPNELGSVVYLREEWGRWGKRGSLRQYFGVFVHEWRWDVVASVVGGVLAGGAGLWFAWWLFWVVKEQRELARWDGMDAVWENIRRGGGEGGRPGWSGGAASPFADEEDGLLRGPGAYRDEPEGEDDGEDFPPRYTDEVQTNKPLPSKPLPEKPLPAVPLIDA